MTTMRGRLFSPKQHQHQPRGRRKAALLGGLSRDTLITLGLFLFSLILFALPNVLLRTTEDDLSFRSRNENENVLSEQQKQQKSLAPQHERDSEGRTRPTTTTTPRRASSSSGSGKKSSSSSSGSSGSSSSSSNNSEQRASDGGIYRRMYNLTEPDVDETIKGTILDVKVTLDALPRIDIDPKILPTGLHKRDAFITQSNAKKFRFETLPKRYLAIDFDAIKLRFKDVDSKLSDSSCALVGSSGNVVGRNFASAIESHDSVVRLNQARADSPLKGNGDKHTQTKDVGERSNFRALSKPWIHKYSLPEKGGLSPADLPLEWGANLILTGATKGITLQSVGLAQALREKWRRTDVQLIVVTPRMEAAARDFFQLYRWKLEKMGFTLKTKGTQPSVGFVAAFALMQVCDRVSLYGFGRTHSDGSKLEKYRYFDSGKGRYPPTREIVSTGMDVEVAIFRALAREKKVVYCDDGEETTMNCGNLHFRNDAFPKSTSSASSERGEGGEEDNNDKDADAEEEGDAATEDSKEEVDEQEDHEEQEVGQEEESDVPSNGWADLV
ncbi:unknown protein [Bathycoccus prasinos]|uniref:Sialyltransferase n=1 Tax=Bathycoccus prasinos TaxID=41875 RepID=K8F2R0_9CHLO|nr:unknown protein [Bathycoccus prasinos]CCO66613.1 unknown protein [Bathycoccus prasinos]|eukprot:XP_007511053.1 unknown protein [Bathycoccus prasinos]